MAPPAARLPQTDCLPDLLRAEGSKSTAARPDRARGAPPTKGEVLVAALYDLAVNDRYPPSARVAAVRLILEYCAGRPAPVQLSIAQDHSHKTYVVISPDDWPR